MTAPKPAPGEGGPTRTSRTGGRPLLPGLLLAGILLIIYGGLALSVDFPRAAIGFQSDESTYYMMGHSLAQDGDLTYRREDLARVYREFATGPGGLFLKKGQDILEGGLMLRPPFFWTRTRPDPDASRLFYGKSFAYPLVAAPFVRLFGTNGFLVLHALLVALVAWCAYLFLQARASPAAAALLTGGFIMASVVPVYFVWITPELFNFALGVFAYFCWLYKEVAPRVPSDAAKGVSDSRRRASRWLYSGASDIVAALLLGLATFSKVTNALLFAPMAIWLLWKRRWMHAGAASAAFVAMAAGLFVVNMAISGEWNYQGGQRITLHGEFPFQTPSTTFESLDQPAHGRDTLLTEVFLDPNVFWTNLGHNLPHFFVGRYAGLLPYFFPAVFAMAAYLVGVRRRPVWQHLVMAGGLAQMLIFVVMTPYTWNGGGGSVGNRYFMSGYGVFLFLIPPIASAWTALVPWIAGSIFVAPMVLNPFVASYRPGDNAISGPLRLLPVELTLVYNWPTNTDPSLVRIWYGDTPKGSSPGFQLYFFDRNAYSREEDASFWVKGNTRAEFLIKTDRPMKRLHMTVTAGLAATEVRATVDGRSQSMTLVAGESRQLVFALDSGFPYEGTWPVWLASVSSSSGFTPMLVDQASTDSRYLGVRVLPTLVE